MRPTLAAFLGAGVVLLLAFTVPSSPARHPGVPPGITNPAVYIFDPYGSGASTGIVNVTPKVPAGSGGAVCTQSQAIGVYDDGGSIGVNCIDTFSGTSTAVTSPPAAPSANQTTMFAFQLDAGWPVIPYNIDNYFGIQEASGIFNVFPMFSTTTKWNVECSRPLYWGTHGFSNFNLGANPATSGSATAPAWATTSLLTRLKRNNYAAAASTNTTAGVIAPNQTSQVAWRGNTAGAGGWLTWIRWNDTLTLTNTRHMIGLLTGTGLIITPTSDPNTFADTVYMGCNQGDSNYSICSNDNSGNATCNSLGASFPCTTNNAFYDLWLAAAPNASSIKYYVERLDSAAVAQGDITSDLPRNTVQLHFIAATNTGSNSSAVQIDWLGYCMAANL